MRVTIYGRSDKRRLDYAARSVYNLTNEEYKIVPFEEAAGEFVLDIYTLRRFDPIIKADISQDGLTAFLSLYPGINGNKELSYDDILSALQERYKLKEAYIDKDVLEEVMKPFGAGLIIEGAKIAQGVCPVDGKNAVIEFLFEKPSQKPKILPNGRVDYKEFSKFIMVRENDLIVKRIPPTPGEKGFSVTGDDIPPVPGEDKTVEVLDGVKVNEDNTEYRAKYNGHILFSGGVVSVLPMLVVSGDVDMRVGNIRFEGTVQVNKNVLAGFSIDADDIIVEGVDENASLTARASVIIKTGIKGQGKGTVKAGADVVLGYAENADVMAGGSVEIRKYCFNSDICADRIFTSSKDAVVTGGNLRAFSEIMVANLGSKGANNMTAVVGISPVLEEKAQKVKEEMAQLSESLQKITDALSKLDLKNPSVIKNPKVRKLIDAAVLIKRKTPLLRKKYEDLKAKSICEEPRIIVENQAMAGVKIKFFEAQIELKINMTRVEFFYNKELEEIGFKAFAPEK